MHRVGSVQAAACLGPLSAHHSSDLHAPANPVAASLAAELKLLPLVVVQVPPRYQGPGVQERVRCHAVAESFDRYALQVSRCAAGWRAPLWEWGCRGLGIGQGVETDSRERGRLLRVCRQVGAQHSVPSAAPQPCGLEPACFAACSALCCAKRVLHMRAALCNALWPCPAAA